MLFFRLSGTTTGAKEIGNMRDKYGLTDRARTINIKTNTYNQKHQQSGYLFVSGVLGRAEDLRVRIVDMKCRANLSFDEEELLTTMEVAYEMNLRGVHFAPADPLRSDPKRFLITDDNRLLIPLNI